MSCFVPPTADWKVWFLFGTMGFKKPTCRHTYQLLVYCIDLLWSLIPLKLYTSIARHHLFIRALMQTCKFENCTCGKSGIVLVPWLQSFRTVSWSCRILNRCECGHSDHKIEFLILGRLITANYLPACVVMDSINKGTSTVQGYEQKRTLLRHHLFSTTYSSFLFILPFTPSLLLCTSIQIILPQITLNAFEVETILIDQIQRLDP